jgi:transposase
MTAGSIPDFLPGCAIDQIEQDEQGLILQAHINGVMASCPGCEQSSMCVHSSYVRSPQDLPIADQAVRIRLCVRRFRCHNPLETSEADILNRICQDSRIERTHQLVQQFRAMVRHHASPSLDTWLEACAASNVADLATFATGIRQDYAAVRAALTTPWSNGQTEGQVNRLKFLKRQMYGRANFDLLRFRVLHPI